jgi:hypothetical protein
VNREDVTRPISRSQILSVVFRSATIISVRKLMARLASVKSTFLELDRSLDSASNLYAAVRPFCEWTFEGVNENPLHPAQGRKVISLCFLACVVAFEQFLEHSFVRYLAGAKGQYAVAPKLRFGPAKSLSDAYAVISGRPGFDPEKHFLNWSVDETLSRAELFFTKANPYSKELRPVKAGLEDAAIIRNRVAHTSAKSRAAFLKVARILRGGQLRQGYSVGDLLLEQVSPTGYKPIQPGDLFEGYVHLFRDVAAELAL